MQVRDDRTMHNTARMVVPCAGFKLDTLLKLADVKGVDRKTSLLHFVLDQLLKESATLASLSAQLRFVRPAANLQVPTPHPPCFAACHILCASLTCSRTMSSKSN